LCLYQVITLIHTLLDNAKTTGMKTCLVLCPLNTVLNWQTEFDLWLKDASPFDVRAFVNIVMSNEISMGDDFLFKSL